MLRFSKPTEQLAFNQDPVKEFSVAGKVSWYVCVGGCQWGTTSISEGSAGLRLFWWGLGTLLPRGQQCLACATWEKGAGAFGSASSKVAEGMPAQPAAGAHRASPQSGQLSEQVLVLYFVPQEPDVGRFMTKSAKSDLSLSIPPGRGALMKLPGETDLPPGIPLLLSVHAH